MRAGCHATVLSRAVPNLAKGLAYTCSGNNQVAVQVDVYFRDMGVRQLAIACVGDVVIETQCKKSRNSFTRMLTGD